MARKSRRDFKREAVRDPYELDLENSNGNGEYVTFKDPNRLSTEDAFELNREDDPQKILQLLLGKDFDPFWDEWRSAPVDECNALIDDVLEHYGIGDRGKPRKLPR